MNPTWKYKGWLKRGFAKFIVDSPAVVWKRDMPSADISG